MFYNKKRELKKKNKIIMILITMKKTMMKKTFVRKEVVVVVVTINLTRVTHVVIVNRIQVKKQRKRMKPNQMRDRKSMFTTNS